MAGVWLVRVDDKKPRTRAASFSTESQRAGRDCMVVDYESMDIIISVLCSLTKSLVPLFHFANCFLKKKLVSPKRQAINHY